MKSKTSTSATSFDTSLDAQQTSSGISSKAKNLIEQCKFTPQANINESVACHLLLDDEYQKKIKLSENDGSRFTITTYNVQGNCIDLALPLLSDFSNKEIHLSMQILPRYLQEKLPFLVNNLMDWIINFLSSKNIEIKQNNLKATSTVLSCAVPISNREGESNFKPNIKAGQGQIWVYLLYNTTGTKWGSWITYHDHNQWTAQSIKKSCFKEVNSDELRHTGSYRFVGVKLESTGPSIYNPNRECVYKFADSGHFVADIATVPVDMQNLDESFAVQYIDQLKDKMKTILKDTSEELFPLIQND